jgi:SAM-dependent methyltransferase
MSKIIRKETAATFEAVYAGGYDKKYPSVDLVRLESWFFKNIPGESLDYGCGPGTNGLHLLDSGYTVVFADVAREALKKVSHKITQRDKTTQGRAEIRAIDLEADDLPETSGTYDYVVAMSVLGNLESADSVQHLLQEFFRVLRPGGKLITDINGENTTYVHDASTKVDDHTYKTVPRTGFDSDEIIMYFPESSDSFEGMVSTAGFVINSVGHSSFSYLDHEDYEYIVCATKPE